MQQGLLPLFPLQVVLLPRTVLPLHIFEDRYKEMMEEVLRTESEFGVVLARENGIVNTGCTAGIDKVVKRYPDGRLDLLTKGRRRFEILLLDEEKSYLRGAVQFFDDEETEAAPEEVRTRALAAARTLSQIEETQLPEDLSPSDAQLSFQLAHLLPDLNFRMLLLRSRSETERLKKLVEYLEEYIPKQRIAAQVRRVAPLNGHGRVPLKFTE
jgi:Lon protease-like protein